MEEGLLMRIWAKHGDILPRFETFRRQRGRADHWCCHRCSEPFRGEQGWRSKTALVERFNITPGGKIWERRRCKCGAVVSLPISEGGEHAESRY